MSYHYGIGAYRDKFGLPKITFSRLLHGGTGTKEETLFLHQEKAF